MTRLWLTLAASGRQPMAGCILTRYFGGQILAPNHIDVGSGRTAPTDLTTKCRGVRDALKHLELSLLRRDRV